MRKFIWYLVLRQLPTSVNRGLVLLSQNGLKFPMRVLRESLLNEQNFCLASSTHVLAFSKSSHSGEGTEINLKRKVLPHSAVSTAQLLLQDATVCSRGGRSSQMICLIGDSQRSCVPCILCRTTRASASNSMGLEDGPMQDANCVFKQLRNV